MGHCAPSVMQTLLDVAGLDAEWLVQATAGLPGGIGNTGAECGGVTAPLVLLGFLHAREPLRRGLPVVVHEGRDLLQRFEACQGTTACREILGTSRVPLRCVGVVRRAPGLCAATLDRGHAGAISEAAIEAYARLYAHWVEQDFHCAHAVLDRLAPALPGNHDLRAAGSAFLGGTVFTGMTCGAFTAGVMGLGLALGTLEDSRPRVVRMIGTMALGGDAFADHLNAFNVVMNLGHRLSKWFTAEHGSTECRATTRCDFSTSQGVQRYIDGGGTARCRAIAEGVADEVRATIGRTLERRAASPSSAWAAAPRVARVASSEHSRGQRPAPHDSPKYRSGCSGLGISRPR